MSTSKLQVARELITEKHYEAARALLKTMPDDPTAKRWLTKLDEIAPVTPVKRSRTPLIATGGIIIAVALIVAIALLITQNRGQTTNSGVAQVQPPPDSMVNAPSQTSDDCGANAWWNYIGGPTIDFMSTVKLAANDLDSFEKDPPTDIDNMIMDGYSDRFDEIREQVQDRDYPLCIKTGRDALISGMYNYGFYIFGRRQNFGAYGSAAIAEMAPDDLRKARELMATAASEINRVTGQNVDFLTHDGIEGSV
jgi:hypothetical protein